MKRRDLRARAVQAIYQMDVGKAEGEAAINYVLADEIERIDDHQQAFVRRLVKGTDSFTAELDTLMTEHVAGWKLDRIARVDLAILRLAAYEIVFEQETDIATILNEAVELAKQFSTDESGRFINGALAKLLPILKIRRETAI